MASTRETLNIRALFGMAGQVPAGLVSRLRKQRMGARLRLGRIEHIFGLATFFADRIVVVHDDRSVRIPIRRHANAKDQEIYPEGERNRGERDKNREDEPSSQSHSQRCRGFGIHSSEIIERVRRGGSPRKSGQRRIRGSALNSPARTRGTRGL
jgi:hypothetical protein